MPGWDNRCRTAGILRQLADVREITHTEGGHEGGDIGKTAAFRRAGTVIVFQVSGDGIKIGMLQDTLENTGCEIGQAAVRKNDYRSFIQTGPEVAVN